MKKKCCQCKSLKDTKLFYKDKTKKDGFGKTCKSCDAKRNFHYKRTSEGRYSRLISKAKCKSIECTLSFDEYIEISKEPCYWCGEEFDRNGGYGIDRIDPNQGYSLNNSVACCWICNNMKSSQSVDKFVVHIVKILNNTLMKL